MSMYYLPAAKLKQPTVPAIWQQQILVLLIGFANLSLSSISVQATSGKWLWRVSGVYDAASTTAMSITGNIKISKGVTPQGLKLTFENGKTVNLLAVGRWQNGAEVFSLDRDPGELMNDNNICGSATDAVKFIVFEDEDPVAGFKMFSMSAYSSASEPTGPNSAQPCASFSFSTN